MPCCIILSTVSSPRVLHFLCVRVCVCSTIFHTVPNSAKINYPASSLVFLCLEKHSLDEVGLNFKPYLNAPQNIYIIISTPYLSAH